MYVCMISSVSQIPNTVYIIYRVSILLGTFKPHGTSLFALEIYVIGSTGLLYHHSVIATLVLHNFGYLLINNYIILRK